MRNAIMMCSALAAAVPLPACVERANAALPARQTAANLRQAPEAEIDTDLLLEHMRAMPEERSIGGGEVGTAGLLEAAAYIRDELAALGHEVFTETVVARRRRGPSTDPVESPNLWADLAGRTHPEEVIYVIAHYDSVPGSPGADDNATAVAAGLELARVLRDRPTRRTVRLLFPTAEEVGLVGTRVHVENVAKPRIEGGEERVIGAISLDMLGYFCDEPGCQRFDELEDLPIPGFITIPDRGDFIAMVGVLPHAGFHVPLATEMHRAEPRLKIFSTGLVPRPLRDMGRSDHGAFWEIGVPGVMITDTANFRTPHYHTPTDTIETLDLERYELVVRAVAGGVYGMAVPAEAGVDGP